jgi:hypothetical protein
MQRFEDLSAPIFGAPNGVLKMRKTRFESFIFQLNLEKPRSHNTIHKILCKQFFMYHIKYAYHFMHAITARIQKKCHVTCIICRFDGAASIYRAPVRVLFCIAQNPFPF